MSRLAFGAILAWGVLGFVVAMTPAALAAAEDQPIAIVEGEAISQAEFQQSLVQTARQRFYHGKIDHEKMAALGDEVVEALVMRRLLLTSADERGIEADGEAIEAHLQQLDERYADNAEWARSKGEILPFARQRLEDDSRIARLERDLRAVAEPDDAALRAYYQANPEKFTEPVQERIAMILIGVAPWAEQEVWQAAAEQAADLEKRLGQGEDFATLAREHSTDPSGQSGGDLGYGHHGMLAAA
ncbi:MAG: SurA N-terminal domain-containing protein, partial [Alphaproteobacteria bacterium]|nr:SurA N-terminal domain-containing protein [Alphaproteobacteria bacterium]